MRLQQSLAQEEQNEAATPRKAAPVNNGRIGNIVSAWRHARKKSKDSSSGDHNSKDANEDFEDDAEEVKAIIEQSSSHRRSAVIATSKGLQQRSTESTTNQL
ncbi:hypothetical protein PG988_013156 [Apiospora saccharicola]